MRLILILVLFSSFNLFADQGIKKTNAAVDKSSEKRFGKTGKDVEVEKTGDEVEAKSEDDFDVGKTGAAVDIKDDKLPTVNPIISANFLVLYDYAQKLQANNGFKIQEVLLQFGATVDKVFEAEVFVAIEQRENRSEFDVFPIGVFGETRTGNKFNFRAGQFLNHFGEHNSRYKHNFPFILAPLINQEMFGERALNFIGVGADWKSIFKDHVEITFEFTQGKNHELFGDEENHYLANLRLIGHHKFTGGHSLKVGASGGIAEIKQGLWGADISYDHVFHPDHNFHLRFEYLGKNKERRQGLYTLVQYRFFKNWEVAYRYEYTGLESNPVEPTAQRHSLLLAALPTYFSGIRFEYSRLIRGDGLKDNRILFQLNQTVGPRRAHSY